MVDENIPNSDAEYIKKMDAQIKQKQKNTLETPPKKTLRTRMQEAVQKRAEKEYEKKIAKAYYLNFFVQDPSGNWALYKTINKQNKKEVKDIRQELINKKLIFKEVEGDIQKGASQLNTYTSRLAKNWKQNLQETGKEIQNEYTKKGGFSEQLGEAFETEKSGMPIMSFVSWGSQNQPKNIHQYPVVGGGRYQATQKSKPKAFVSHRDYQYYLYNGYTAEQLSTLGVYDERSPYFEEFSKFGRSVAPYRPVSAGQCFYREPPTIKTELEERLAKGESWVGFKPEFVGAPDTAPVIFSPPMLKMLFSQGIGKNSPMFSPMMQINEYDAQGKLVVKKKFFKPEIAKL
jgi:hypothetical protein